MPSHQSIDQVLSASPWSTLEEHLNDLTERVDQSIAQSHVLRERYREELLSSNPELYAQIKTPSPQAIENARHILLEGSVAAADGTLSPVPLLSGSKIQVGVVIAFNHGSVVDFVTRIFETDLINDFNNATEFFAQLRSVRSISNLLSRAIMLYGERRLLLNQTADWRMIHGELIPHELRTGAGRPEQNLPPTFALINEYIASEQFLAVSEASDDIDILNAAILLEPGEYIVIKHLTDVLTSFLDGDSSTGQSGANFNRADAERFRQFIQSAGPNVAIVLAKAGAKPFMIECHSNRIEEAVALFFADALWTRGLPVDGSALGARGFPFHIDLADQIARTLFKGSDFRNFVESRLFDLGIEAGLFDIDPRRTR